MLRPDMLRSIFIFRISSLFFRISKKCDLAHRNQLQSQRQRSGLSLVCGLRPEATDKTYSIHLYVRCTYHPVPRTSFPLAAPDE